MPSALMCSMKPKFAAMLVVFLLLLTVALMVATMRNRDSNEVLGHDGRKAKLERYEFKATPVRYSYPSNAPQPSVEISSPAFRGEKLLSAEFSWQVGPEFPCLASALRFAEKKAPASWSNFWTGYPGASALRIATVDDVGNEFDPVSQHSGMFQDYNGREYSVEDVPVFPRRGKTVHLRLLDNGNLLAEFVIPNPAPGPHPEWTAQSLPIHQTDGDLDVALAGFRAIHPAINSGKYERTECVFNFQENSHGTAAWAPVLFEVSDATGNHWQTSWNVGANPFPLNLENGSVRTEFLGALWPSESAWKLRCEFKRTGDFPKSELLEITKIQIPDSGEFSEPHTRYEWNGAVVEVAGVMGKHVDRQQIMKKRVFLLANAEQRMGCVTVALSGNILSKHRRLTFISATDDQGRELKLAGFEQPGDAGGAKWVPYSLVFQTQEGAKEINLVVAVSVSRFVEFLAKPEQVKE